MASPRPHKSRPWTQAEHEENARAIQRTRDKNEWERIARKLGLRPRDFAGLLGRFLDERLAAALRTYQPSLIDQLQSPADAEALRGALSDLISDDVAEMFQILSGQETQHERSDTEETPGSGGEDAAYEQGEIYGDEAEDGDTEDSERT